MGCASGFWHFGVRRLDAAFFLFFFGEAKAKERKRRRETVSELGGQPASAVIFFVAFASAYFLSYLISESFFTLLHGLGNGCSAGPT
jgi:hypothetical protein